jgi:hypothetical protein
MLDSFRKPRWEFEIVVFATTFAPGMVKSVNAERRWLQFTGKDLLVMNRSNIDHFL